MAIPKRAIPHNPTLLFHRVNRRSSLDNPFLPPVIHITAKAASEGPMFRTSGAILKYQGYQLMKNVRRTNTSTWFFFRKDFIGIFNLCGSTPSRRLGQSLGKNQIPGKLPGLNIRPISSAVLLQLAWKSGQMIYANPGQQK
jgi:hypothetical protein